MKEKKKFKGNTWNPYYTILEVGIDECIYLEIKRKDKILFFNLTNKQAGKIANLLKKYHKNQKQSGV